MVKIASVLIYQKSFFARNPSYESPGGLRRANRGFEWIRGGELNLVKSRISLFAFSKAKFAISTKFPLLSSY